MENDQQNQGGGQANQGQQVSPGAQAAAQADPQPQPNAPLTGDRVTDGNLPDDDPQDDNGVEE